MRGCATLNADFVLLDELSDSHARVYDVLAGYGIGLGGV